MKQCINTKVRDFPTDGWHDAVERERVEQDSRAEITKRRQPPQGNLFMRQLSYTQSVPPYYTVSANLPDVQSTSKTALIGMG